MDSRHSVRIPGFFRFVLSGLFFFLYLIIAQSIAANHWTVNEQNVLQAPAWYAPLLLFSSIFFTVLFYMFMKRYFNSPDSSNSPSGFILLCGQILRFFLCVFFFCAFSAFFFIVILFLANFLIKTAFKRESFPAFLLLACLFFSAVPSFFIVRIIWKSMSISTAKRNIAPAAPIDPTPTIPTSPAPAPIVFPQNKDEIENLIKKSIAFQNAAISSLSISHFSDYWNSSIECLEKAAQIVPDSTCDDYQTIQRRLSMLHKNYLWKFRDAIEREESAVFSDISGEYRNNKRGRCSDFSESIMAHWNTFDDETRQFARDAIQRVSDRLNLPIPMGSEVITPESRTVPAPLIVNKISLPPDISAQLSAIDEMEGIQFEHWCADLLSRNGFSNVSVTQASNDQGADILAQKDGIKYCIQCKRYNSPLGNAPVQEIHSACSFYRCQVGAVITNCYFTSGAKKLAHETGTLLWDRDWIKKLLETSSPNNIS